VLIGKGFMEGRTGAVHTDMPKFSMGYPDYQARVRIIRISPGIGRRQRRRLRIA